MLGNATSSVGRSCSAFRSSRPAIGSVVRIKDNSTRYGATHIQGHKQEAARLLVGEKHPDSRTKRTKYKLAMSIIESFYNIYNTYKNQHSQALQRLAMRYDRVTHVNKKLTMQSLFIKLISQGGRLGIVNCHNPQVSIAAVRLANSILQLIRWPLKTLELRPAGRHFCPYSGDSSKSLALTLSR